MAWRYDEAHNTWWDDEPIHTQLRTEFGYPVSPMPQGPDPGPVPPPVVVDPAGPLGIESLAGGWLAPTETVAITPPPEGHPELAATANEQDHTDPWAYAGEVTDAPV